LEMLVDYRPTTVSCSNQVNDISGDDAVDNNDDIATVLHCTVYTCTDG